MDYNLYNFSTTDNYKTKIHLLSYVSLIINGLHHLFDFSSKIILVLNILKNLTVTRYILYSV